MTENMGKYSLNKAQREAVEYTSGPLLIVAGAGTGKTTVITSKICRLIEEKLAKPEEILALTFTEKAAAEMQDRVDEITNIGYADLHISTFHAFCQKILERHAIDIGLSNSFKLLTDTAGWVLLHKNLDKFNLDYYRPLGNPTKHIHEFLKHFSKCKDELITPQEYLEYAEGLKLNNGRDPTLPSPLRRRGDKTPSSAEEGVGGDLAEVERLTEIANAYHTYNQLLLDNALFDFGDLLFYTVKLFRERPNVLKMFQNKYKYILVDEFQDVNYSQYELIKLLADASLSFRPEPQRGEVEKSLSQSRTDRDSLPAPCLRMQEAGSSASGLARNDNIVGPNLTVVGDDDQSIYAFRGASVANILRFKDDYPTAKEVVLSENFRSGQKILDVAYESIQNNNPDRLEVKLKIDKRLKAKRPSVISTTKEKSLAHQTMNRDSLPAPCLRMQEAGSSASGLARNDNGDGVVIHLHKPTVEDEVAAVLDEITRIKTVTEGVTWDDFAILVRANNHADAFINQLQTRGIPYEFLASSGLYRQPIILDCINFFKLLNNYHESSAIYRLLCLPFFEFRENDLQKITFNAKRKSISYYEALKRAPEFDVSQAGISVCAKLVEVIHAGLQSMRYEKPSVVLYSFLENSGYLKYLTHQENEGKGDVIRQIHYLKQFFDYIAQYESVTPEAHVVGFIEHFMMVVDAGDKGSLYQPSDTPDSVNILTVHASKGLEFRYVFVVNLVEDRFPSRSRSDALEIPLELVKEQLPEGDSHIQEERRLFYVAMTRAKERLYFTSASDYGGTRTKKISRFLAELDFGSVILNGAKRSEESLSAQAGLSQSPTDGQGSFASLRMTKKVNEMSERVYETPKTFSFSQLRSYETCPYQYKLAHILHIPMKGSASFSFGSSMHNTLQAFYERVIELNSSKQVSLFDTPKPSVIPSVVEGSLSPTSRDSSTPLRSGRNDKAVKVPEFEELLKMYDAKWISDWFKDKRQREDMYKKGKEILKIFYTSQEGNWNIPIGLESWFKIKVGDYVINGRIDRLDQLPDGTIEIIDYKTGQGKDKLTSDDKEQLLLYQIAVEEIAEFKAYGKPSKLTFYYLNDDLKTSFIGEPKDTEKLKEKFKTTIESIVKGDFTATPSQFICGRCDFRDICEFRV